MDSASSRNIGLRPVRQADILSAFDSHGSGVQLRWAHRPGGLCSVPAECDRLAAHSTALRAGSVLPGPCAPAVPRGDLTSYFRKINAEPRRMIPIGPNRYLPF